MAYPERGASYDHNPKFIDRMKAAERADGGEIGTHDEALQSMPHTAGDLLQGGTFQQKMRTDEGGRGLSDWRGSFGDDELSSTQGKKGD